MQSSHFAVPGLRRSLQRLLIALGIMALLAFPIHTAHANTSKEAPSAAAIETVHQRLAEHLVERYGVRLDRAHRIVREAVRQGNKYDVRPEMLLAIMAVESTFKEHAVSPRGARGLMQINPKAHADAVSELGGHSALLDADKNILLGARILSNMLERSRGNMRKALLQYNGSAHLRRSRYADKVLRQYNAMVEVTASAETGPATAETATAPASLTRLTPQRTNTMQNLLAQMDNSTISQYGRTASALVMGELIGHRTFLVQNIRQTP